MNLTLRKQRIIAALTDFPEGHLSYTLGEIAGAMNIADEIMHLRRMGFDIVCRMEPFITQDGEKSRVGRYVLQGSRGPQI